MANKKPLTLSAEEYEQLAREYMRSLPLEHFAEAVGQSHQRAITLKSLAVLTAWRPDVQVFNELSVQYHHGRDSRPHQVVPDTMVLVWPEPIKANLTFAVPLQPVRPLWVLDYLSKYSKRKDYEDHFRRFELELKVLYYLVIDTDKHQFILYHHTGRKYVPVKPNASGRLDLPDLNLEIGLLDESVRYWYQGELLLLPAGLLGEIARIKAETEKYHRIAEEAKERAKAANKVRQAMERKRKRLQKKLSQDKTLNLDK
jgi:Uma2 family endonuclease